MPIPVRVALLLLLAFGIGNAQQGARTVRDADQVWSAEEAYWRYMQAYDVEHFVAFYSDDFVGWPLRKKHPIHKAEIVSDFKSGTSPLARAIAYELHRESVEMHGSIGIAFYLVEIRQRSADGSVVTNTRRLSHTWMKNGQVWQIVAGMSSPDGESPNSTKP